MYFVHESHMVGNFSGTKKFAAVIFADEKTDLPAYNECAGIDGELTLGSIALVASEATFYTMTSDGEWHVNGEDDT